MSLNWEDERYVRLYTHDTITWKMIGWQGRCLLPLLLRKVDRAGCIDMDGAGAAGLAALVDIPEEIAEPGLAALLARGVVDIKDDVLIFPKFLAAQEAKQSDKQRQIESRGRRRAAALRSHSESQRVTNRDTESQIVTERHTASHGVTLCSAQPSSSVQSSDQKKSSAREPIKPLDLWRVLADRAGPKFRLERKSTDTEAGVPYSDFANFTHAAVGLSKRSPPYATEHYETAGDWIAAGGLDWHAKNNTPPWKRACERLEQVLSAADEWHRNGRQPIGKTERAPPGWRPDPTIGSNAKDYAKENDEWLSRQG